MNSRSKNLSHVIPDDDDPVRALLALRSQGTGTTLVQVSSHSRSSVPIKGQRDTCEEFQQTDAAVDNQESSQGHFYLQNGDSKPTPACRSRDDQHYRNQCVTYVGQPMPLPPRLLNPGPCPDLKLQLYSSSSRNDHR
jgi:hypothetical protein